MGNSRTVHRSGDVGTHLASNCVITCLHLHRYSIPNLEGQLFSIHSASLLLSTHGPTCRVHGSCHSCQPPADIICVFSDSLSAMDKLLKFVQVPTEASCPTHDACSDNVCAELLALLDRPGICSFLLEHRAPQPSSAISPHLCLEPVKYLSCLVTVMSEC